MNERIRECWIKAAREDAGETWDSQEQFIERFAELIVRECVNCVRGAGLTDEVAVKNNLGFNDGLSAAVVNVQKHFGVEE
jgi:hypothetical protein